MRIILLILSLSLALAGSSQRVVNVDKNDFKTVSGSLFYTINGEPVSTVKYIRLVEGTPFFQDSWMRSIIILKSGERVSNLPAKLELVENDVYFKNSRGEEMVPTQPVMELVLMNKAEDSLFRFVHSDFFGNATQVKKGWYQWLASGKASLYKFYDKELFAQKPYGSATEEQRIVTKEHYFLFHNDVLVRIKSLKALPELLGKKQELEQHLKNQGRAASLDDQMSDLIVYYNSLVSK